MHWSEMIADRIIRRNPDKEEYVCAAGISPSGSIHIGNFRDIATSYFVVRALIKKGKKAKLLFSWDEFDRMRKVPVNVAAIDDDMEKYIYIFVIMFVVVVIPIALYVIFKPMFRQNKLLNGIVNYDTFMRKFVFRIEITKEEFYSQLKIRNINDVLEYSLNEDCSVITFTMYNKKYSYKIIVDDFNESIILRVEQIQITSRPAFHINEFFIKKFNATPSEFEKYSF